MKYCKTEDVSSDIVFIDPHSYNYLLKDSPLLSAGDLISLKDVNPEYHLQTAPIGVYTYIKGIYREEKG